MDKCCYQCSERVLGCHSTCDTYNKALAIQLEINKKIRKESLIRQDIMAQVLRGSGRRCG